MRLRPSLPLLSLLLSSPAVAQQPGPDLWLAELRWTGGTPTAGAPANLTRRAGYDNQPWFLPDGRALLYVAEHEGQTDVYRYDLASGQSSQVTRTPEWREYSPTLSADGAEMRVVRWDRPVERGELWRYSASGEPLSAIGGVPQVGYYAFADPNTLALFLNIPTRPLVVADTRTGRADTVATGIAGSAPQRIPDSDAVSIVTQGQDGHWWITRVDPRSRALRPLVQALPGNIHYAWTRRGTILMGRGNALYHWDPKGGPGWALVATLPGLRNISRIALSPGEDRVVVVAEPDAQR